MKKYGFEGLEIAPTRIIPKDPYDSLKKASEWRNRIHSLYGFNICSLQSIWYGRKEMLFGSDDESRFLLSYTQKAVDLAATLDCGNLVFGCPKNRLIPENASFKKGIDFFKKLGKYAASKHTVIGMEANPAIYGTNYINDTISALELIKEVDSPGFGLNLDIGTMIENEENIRILYGCEKYINHVHISEPFLAPVKPREIHKELKDLLESCCYSGYVSIEMKTTADLTEIEQIMRYVKEVFA